MILQTNTTYALPSPTGNASSPLKGAGPEGTNQYVTNASNQAQSTPEIPGPNTTTNGSDGITAGTLGLIGGADVFGIVGITGANGAITPVTPATLKANTTTPDDTLVSNAISDAPAGALVAVIYEQAPAGLPNYQNDDVVYYINLTGVNLANPELGLVTNSSTSTAESPLQFGGVAANSSVGGSGSYTTLTSLPAGEVWATLVPSGTAYLNATLSGLPVALSSSSGQIQVTPPSLSNDGVYYITAQAPAPTAGAVIPSLQATAVSPDGQNLYAVNSAENLLVVANASNLTQRQTFQNNLVQANGTVVTGLGDPVAVAVSPDGNDVYVASGSEQEIAIFSRSATGDLVFQEVQPVSGIGSLTSLAVYSSSGGTDLVYVGGTGGVSEFQGNTSNSTLCSEVHTAAVRSNTDVSVSSDGTLLYAASPSNNALYVFSTPLSTSSTPMLDQTLAST